MALREGTDAHLVARAREGDAAALDQLIARHRGRLFGIARHMTGSADAAQDIVQEALVSALTSLSCLRDGNSFGKWLNTIVRRQVVRWRRERDRRPEPVGDLVLRGAPAAVWDRPEVASPELLESIREALEVLKRRDRQVMVLHYLEGRTCDEIASIMGLSQGGVKRILHDSRNKVREEYEAMSETGGEPRIRRLRHWIAGSVVPQRANVFYRLKHRLAQAVCLSVNKRPKTVKQISEQVGAHADYVADTVQDLAEIDVLESPGKRRYLANFIALDGEDWRRLTKFVPEPAGEAAKRLAAAEDRLRGAFEKTQLAAAGWEWNEVAWVIYAVLAANMGVSHTQPDSYRSSAPKRPDGGRYWLGGCEEAEDLPTLWGTGLNSSFGKLEGLEVGHWWSWGLEREHPTAFSAGDDAYTALAAFRQGPLTEAEVLGRLGGDAEHWQGILAHLIKDGVLRRVNGEIRAGIPIFTQQESDVLTDEVKSVVAPITGEVAEPALALVPEALDKMGYGHRQEQYPQWLRWLAGDIMGEALRFLMEQGVLPRPPRRAPATFAMLAWESGIPLMLP
jgi:RNA polymerase sigma-70 factor (ECF subfamily)